MLEYPQQDREHSQPPYGFDRLERHSVSGGDVDIATWAKAGTTWTQQIVAQIAALGPDPQLERGRASPWLDLRVALPVSESWRCIEAQHRSPDDSRPTCRSTHSPYLAQGRSTSTSGAMRATWCGACSTTTTTSPTGLRGCSTRPPGSSALRSIARRRYPPVLAANGSTATVTRTGIIWENIRSWWEIRDLPNVMLVHFNELKADMEGRIARTSPSSSKSRSIPPTGRRYANTAPSTG